MRLVLILAAIVVSRNLFCKGCKRERLLSCVIDLQKELIKSEIILNADQLNSYCDKFSLAHGCVAQQSQKCSPEVKSMYLNAIKDEQIVIKRICEPGVDQDRYLQQAECMSAIFLERTADSCRSPYFSLLSTLSELLSSDGFSLQKMCCAYYSVHGCISRKSTFRCGARRIDRTFLKQIFNGLNENCSRYKAICDNVIENQIVPNGSVPTESPSKGNSSKNITRPFCALYILWTLFVWSTGL